MAGSKSGPRVMSMGELAIFITSWNTQESGLVPCLGSRVDVARLLAILWVLFSLLPPSHPSSKITPDPQALFLASPGSVQQVRSLHGDL